MVMQERSLLHNKWLHIGLLILSVFLVYSKLFHGGFMTWDDPEYVINNTDITTLANWKNWFSSFYVGNYQPLTILSYAIDFAVGGTEPFIYHLTNIVFHAANAVLVYLFIDKITGNKPVALFVTLLFALHPTQTESVSWIAERKNVLYGFFFLLALYQYLVYITSNKQSRLIWVIVFGLLAMLCKAAAISLPIALFAVDVWMNRSLKEKKIWLAKIPLLLLAVIVAYIGVKAQDAGTFLNMHPEYTTWDTIVFAGYAYVQYIVQLLLPVKLSVLYPYPSAIGFIHVFYLGIAAGILLSAVIAYRKQRYTWCGGIVFYTANIAIVLQFVQFGEVLMADRYLYIAAIGIWYPVVYYLYLWAGKFSKQWLAVVGLIVMSCTAFAMTYQRNDIWLSEHHFWSSVVETFPNSSVAQSSMGGVYLKEGNYPEALQHIDQAIEIDPNNYKAWYNKGVIHLRQNNAAASLAVLDKAISINEYPKALFTRALLFQQVGKPLQALADIDKVLAKEPENARAYFIKADCLEQQNNLQNAIDNYTKAIAYQSDDPLFYMRRGIAYAKVTQTVAALSDLDKAIQMNDKNAAAWYWRGMVKYRTNQSPCADFDNAVRLGSKDAVAAKQEICK
jgi:tetratricopeptide (TPR) repeat protein